MTKLFCPLGQAKSLREIEEGLLASEGKLRHLGRVKALGHSTLAHANEHRPWEICETLTHSLRISLMTKLGPVRSGSNLGLSGKFLSLDRTVIDLNAKVFAWAKYRAAKTSVQPHLLIDYHGLISHDAAIIAGKTSGKAKLAM